MAETIGAVMTRGRYHFFFKTAVVFCSITILFLGYKIYQLSVTPMMSKGQPPVIIHFKKNTSASSLVDTLIHHNLLRSGHILVGLISIKGKASQLKAGIYQINPDESALQFVSRVARGDVLKQSFTIVEGTTKKQIIENLKKAPFLFYNPSDWSAVKGENHSDEGMLLADTYRYEAGSQSADLLARANTDLVDYLNKSWLKRSPGLPYQTPYEMLTVASILEKETSIREEKSLVAGVIVNRLRKNMPLQVDPTVIYALGTQYDGKLTRKGLQIDSPFNTYKYRGLPPTPIAMVGKDAIDAAAHPTATDYLYFVAKGDGAHQFSVTYEQQKQAIEKFLKQDTQ